METIISFGRWIKLRRIALELSQAEFARLVGCATVTIRKIEADERRPSRQIAERMALSLQVKDDERAGFIQAALALRSPIHLPSPMHPVSSATLPGNLPILPTRSIGRTGTIVDCARLYAHGARLVTLTGPGGVGKTRLAIEVASILQAEFVNGSWFVNLAPVRDPERVPDTIAQTLGVRAEGNEPLQSRLAAYLREKALLLVLDNCEHLLDAAPFVAELLAAAPRLCVLATSRAILRLSGEHEFVVPPLALPTPPFALGKLQRYAAVELFVERARAVRPGFAPSAADADVLAAICLRLEGLPLAIELAAARSKILDFPILLGQLQNRLTFLINGARDLPARQQTLRGAIAWSYDLLSAEEQLFFERLAVFVGGCSLAAAEWIGAEAGIAQTVLAVGSGDQEYRVYSLTVLEALVNQSLLRTEAAAEHTRFVMLETIREFALERLNARGMEAAEQASRDHAWYFLDLAEQAEHEIARGTLTPWLSRLDAEEANFWAALEWCNHTNSDEAALLNLRLSAALFKFWELRGRFSQGRAQLAKALARAHTPTTVRAKALHAAGWMAFHQTDAASARSLYEESLAIYRQHHDLPEIADVLASLARVLGHQQKQPEAIALLQESLAIGQQLGNVAHVANIFTMMAWVQNEPVRAAEGLEHALALYRTLDDTQHILSTLSYLSLNLWLLGEYPRAIALQTECLARARDSGADGWIVHSFNNLGLLDWLQGNYTNAQTWHTQALAQAREMMNTAQIAMALRNLGADVWALGEYAEAIMLLRESLPLYVRWGDAWGIAECLESLGWAYSSQGQAVSRDEYVRRAACLLGAAASIREDTGRPMAPAYREVNERMIAETQVELGTHAFDEAWAAGHAMSQEQAVAAALA